MSENSTINMISKYLKEITKQREYMDMSEFTTLKISNTLHISRTLSSQYLNILARHGELIKINSRPVYFLDKSTLERQYTLELKHLEYSSFEELDEILNKQRYQSQDLERAIGYYGSLYECFKQIISSICYPHCGLPIILSGEIGVGKSYIVSLIFEYLQNHNMIAKGQTLEKLLITNNSNINYSSILFGNKERSGILNSGQCALLYIKDFDRLDEKTQIKLSKYLSNTQCQYEISADDKQVILVKNKTRIILGISHQNTEFIHDELLLKIPIIHHKLHSIKSKVAYCPPHYIHLLSR